jgi:hypothetical protein
MSRGQRFSSFVAASVLLLVGCEPPPVLPPLVETVAVLPFDNESNNLDAPDILQKLVFEALKDSPYKSLEIDAVNGKLEKVGIVDGGQLAIVDPTKLGKDLGVQALIFGYVENFDYTNIGFYLQRKVKLDLKMVDVQTGATLWEGSGTGMQPQVFLNKDEAKKAFLEGVAKQTIDKIAKSPLDAEAKTAVENALRKLPGFKFHGFGSGKKDLLKGLIKN